MSSSFDVVVLGSANLDLVATTSRIPGAGETVLGSGYAEYPGGKGLNQAIAAARSGAKVAMVGAVGSDDAGRRLADAAESDGIDVTRLRRVADVPTGRALITVDDRAENSIVVVPGANAEVGDDELPATQVLIAQLEIPASAVLGAFRAARARGVRTVLNPAPAADLRDELLDVCDVVVPNEHEVDLIGGVDELHRRGVSVVIVTMGSRGVAVSTADGVRSEYPPFPVDAIDTTGAGDSFCGGFAARLAAGDELADAVRWAAAAGALATTQHGAVPAIPHAAEIRRLVTGG